MATDWPTKLVSVPNVHLDSKNPRLGRETGARAPRAMIQYLFEHDKTLEIAESIAASGYFPNEPLLVIRDNDQLVVVEGNRRLAALKALREPGLLEGAIARKVERLARKIEDPQTISKVPVTIAPSRRATDRQIARRHIGTAVLPWQLENRASFILDKIEEGYSNDEIRDQLGFTLTDIQQSRQIRAIADMARSLELPEEIKAKIESPRAKLFTTVERVFDSTVGREYLMVEPNAEHGIVGKTTKAEFLRGFTKLVTDLALGHQSSRSLNNNDDIKRYFESWDPAERPAPKRGSFIPSDIITGKSVASAARTAEQSTRSKSKKPTKSVLPRDFKVRFGNDRLVDIRDELVKLKRDEHHNSGAVLLRVFFELAVVNYLERTGRLENIIEKLGGRGKLPFGTPTMKQLVPEMTRVAREQLSTSEAQRVEKAIKYDASAPFTLADLHAFVHQSADLPGERDILQFWLRTEPLFRLMLEREPQGIPQ